jgi:hypothetical protein
MMFQLSIEQGSIQAMKVCPLPSSGHGTRSGVAANGMLRAAYAAFNVRDPDATLATMTSDVALPNRMEGGYVKSSAATPDVAEVVEAVFGCKWSLRILGLIRKGVCRPGEIE